MRKAKENVFSLPDPVECLLCCLSVCLKCSDPLSNAKVDIVST